MLNGRWWMGYGFDLCFMGPGRCVLGPGECILGPGDLEMELKNDRDRPRRPDMERGVDGRYLFIAPFDLENRKGNLDNDEPFFSLELRR